MQRLLRGLGCCAYYEVELFMIAALRCAGCAWTLTAAECWWRV